MGQAIEESSIDILFDDPTHRKVFASTERPVNATEDLMSVTTNPVDPITPEDLITELRRLQDRIPLFGAMTPAQQSTIVRVAPQPTELVFTSV